jgi:hypothetical protein
MRIAAPMQLLMVRCRFSGMISGIDFSYAAFWGVVSFKPFGRLKA